ncbi:ROK family protein [bacterium]|nr:ROK family protein [bacterium]
MHPEAIHPNDLFIGLDLTQGIQAGLFDSGGRAQGPLYRSGFRPSDRDSLHERVLSIALEMIGRCPAGKGKLRGVGICGPETWDPEPEDLTGRCPAPQLPELALRLQKSLDLPAFFESTAGALALGAAHTRLGHKLSRLICIWYGSPLGAAVVLDGELITGARRACADLEHTVILLNGAERNEPQYRTLGELIGPRSIFQQAFSAIRQGPTILRSVLLKAGGEALDPESVILAAARNDRAAVAIVGEINRYLAVALANLIHLFAPGAVFWGGFSDRRRGAYFIENFEHALAPLLTSPGTVRQVQAESGVRSRTRAAANLARVRLACGRNHSQPDSQSGRQ